MFLNLKIDTRPSKSKDLVPDLGFAVLSVYGGRLWNFEPWPLGFVLISVSTSFLVSILHVFKTSLFVFCCDFEVTEEKLSSLYVTVSVLSLQRSWVTGPHLVRQIRVCSHKQ